MNALSPRVSMMGRMHMATGDFLSLANKIKATDPGTMRLSNAIQFLP
jgi:hypothetical protein